jgi:hypothetical protein
LKLHAAALAAMLACAMPLASPSASAASTPSWAITPSPNGAHGHGANDLRAVTCSTPSACWAVGSAVELGGAYQTLAEQYNGRSWSLVSTPNGPSGDSFLNGIACVDPTNCWAVGELKDSNGLKSALVEHYYGGAWSIVSSPVAGTQYILNAVTCVSAADCWAVGWSQSAPAPEPVDVPLTEHYDGSSWSVVPARSPEEPGIPELRGVSCAGTSDCWAVGSQKEFCPRDRTNQSCIQTVIEHYDGSLWRVTESPNGLGINNELASVSCATASYCIAVGSSGGEVTTASGITTGAIPGWATLVERYDGGTWSVVSSPNHGDPATAERAGNFLESVSCATVKFCVAAGKYFDEASSKVKTLIEQSNGPAWTIAPSRDLEEAGERPGEGRNALTAVTCTSGCFAVGATKLSEGRPITLIEQYVGPDPVSTTLSCSPNPGAVRKRTTCTARLSDALNPLRMPTGTVTWSAGTGRLSSTTCTLRRGSCSVKFRPRSAIARTITASYGGDATHLAEQESMTLQVLPSG